MKSAIKTLWNQIRYAAADVIDLVGLLICIPSKPLYDFGCFLMQTSARVENTINVDKITDA